ncbi:hypothetical protein HDU98_005898 [Podochytrium sp. JEL0797]|nr:hypothetical protein HDU98_005898 [Podochytrium sp. JEL0797]
MLFLCLAIFALSFGHEYLQLQRNILETRYTTILNRGRSDANDGDTEESGMVESQGVGKVLGSTKGSLERIHMLRTGYHVASSFSSLVIMTVFMTLNCWLVAAILGGSGLGFYMFQARVKRSVGGSSGLQCH